MAAPEDSFDEVGLEEGLLEEAGEVGALVSSVVASAGAAAPAAYDRFKQIVSVVWECTRSSPIAISQAGSLCRGGKGAQKREFFWRARISAH